MKIQYKLALMAAGILVVSSCEKNDPLADRGQIGQEVPTCFWSVGSTACKAGEEFSFNGKYYSSLDTKPDHSEVWYLVKRDESASAQVKIAGTALSFTKSFSTTDTVRDNQVIATYPHLEEYWNGTAYEFNATVPTSSTLSPVTWVSPRTWDAKKYADYYPEGFDQEFIAEVINMMTKDSTYYNGLRAVYMNYPYTNEQFAAINAKYNVNFPTDIKFNPSDPQEAVTDKSERWFQTTEASEDKIVGWYYKYVDGNGNTVIHEETGKDKPANDGHNWYPVYDSSPWVFCRYDDDAGAIVRAVRANWMDAFRELLSYISFPDWIYDRTDGTYAVTFSRIYSLDAQFKVYDTAGNIGVASDIRTIKLN